jgi:polysaccharide deacetylase family protein (PEP-CTERM system associated)
MRPVTEAWGGGGAIINAMTIDVEDYFHVSVFDGVVPRHQWNSLESRVTANTDRVLEMLDEARVRATFFTLGWVAERFPRLVRRVAELGHEIASHGYAHRLIYDQTRTGFRDDVRRAKDLLESTSGSRVDGFRAPSYSVTARSLWALDVLIEEGYRYDASIFPIRHDRYGIPLSARHAYVLEREGGSLVEAPASTVRWGAMNLPIAGGGYFRLLPYAWTRWGIDRLNGRERKPAIFYLHPWEIDPDQPRLKTGALSRLRHYRNLDKTASRFRTLLRDFQFAPLGTVLNGLALSDAAATSHRRPVEGRPDTARVPLPYLW